MGPRGVSERCRLRRPTDWGVVKQTCHASRCPPTTPGEFRVSHGGDETHTAENLGSTASDFLCVEFKTDPAGATTMTADGTALPWKIGQERWVPSSRRERLTNVSAAQIELLRVDVLTAPQPAPSPAPSPMPGRWQSRCRRR